MEAQESFKTNIVLDPLTDKQRNGLREGSGLREVNLIVDYASIFSRW